MIQVKFSNQQKAPVFEALSGLYKKEGPVDLIIVIHDVEVHAPSEFLEKELITKINQLEKFGHHIESKKVIILMPKNFSSDLNKAISEVLVAAAYKICENSKISITQIIMDNNIYYDLQEADQWAQKIYKAIQVGKDVCYVGFQSNFVDYTRTIVSTFRVLCTLVGAFFLLARIFGIKRC